MAKPTRSYQLPPSLALPHTGPDVLHLNRRQEKLNEGSSSPAAWPFPPWERLQAASLAVPVLRSPGAARMRLPSLA